MALTPRARLAGLRKSCEASLSKTLRKKNSFFGERLKNSYNKRRIDTTRSGFYVTVLHLTNIFK